jgi:hypothetical protein
MAAEAKDGLTAEQVQHIYDLAWVPFWNRWNGAPDHWPHCDEGDSPFCSCADGPPIVAAGELLTGGATDGRTVAT